MSDDQSNKKDESQDPNEPHQPELDGLAEEASANPQGRDPQAEGASAAEDANESLDASDEQAVNEFSLDHREGSTEPRSVANRAQDPDDTLRDIGEFSDTWEEEEDDAYPQGYKDSSESETSEANAGMSFLEHLEEFRWTIARSGLAFIVGVLVVVIFHKDIAQLIQLPLHKAYGSAEVARENLITYKAMGVISVFFQIALLGGLTLSMPFMLYFLGSFIAPGLTEKEQRLLRPSCFAAFALFLTGVAFAFFIILPLALAFTVRLNQHLGFDIFWAASDYYNMVVWFSLAIGAFFQFPLVVVLLVYIGILATGVLKQARRIVFVGLMIFSALVSPGGDPVSLTVTTGFMYGLYELAIWVGARIERRKLADQEGEG